MGTLLSPSLAGAAQLPLVEELPGVGIDLWEMCVRLAGLPHLVFLDSALPVSQGRFSFLSADPFEWIWSKGPMVFSSAPPPFQSAPPPLQKGGHGGVAGAVAADPFLFLAQRLAKFQQPAVPGLPPWQGGAAGLFGFDLCHHLERLPRPVFDDFAIPELAVGLYDWVLAFDGLEQKTYLVSTGWPETEPRRQQQRARKRLHQAKRWLQTGTTLPAWPQVEPCPLQTPQFPAEGLTGLLSNFPRQDYLATIGRAIEYVHAGDCFQVNIAQRLLTPATMSPLDLYQRLRLRNPAPFAGYFDLGEFVLASASPERFVQLRQGEVLTCPIKGTRPRGNTPQEDKCQAEELRNCPKDRAENIMIVDLLRNDLGRVCRYGSIRVEALCRLESYQYVHHLVSEIRGRLREKMGAVDLLRAAFPGGSVTGAPKIRAMEIITELERTARGPYCGCLGYIGFDGTMDTNLLIRTFVVGKGWTNFAVGGGIVADSDPQREYEETLHKAAGLLRALEE